MRISYVKTCKYCNTLDDSQDAKEVFFWYADMPNPLKGPTKVDSRFISEDVSQGLVLLETLGSECKVDTPICTALIDISSAALDRDLQLEGRTVDCLGENNIKNILEDEICVYA